MFIIPVLPLSSANMDRLAKTDSAKYRAVIGSLKELSQAI